MGGGGGAHHARYAAGGPGRGKEGAQEKVSGFRGYVRGGKGGMMHWRAA